MICAKCKTEHETLSQSHPKLCQPCVDAMPPKKTKQKPDVSSEAVTADSQEEPSVKPAVEPVQQKILKPVVVKYEIKQTVYREIMVESVDQAIDQVKARTGDLLLEINPLGGLGETRKKALLNKLGLSSMSMITCHDSLFQADRMNSDFTVFVKDNTIRDYKICPHPESPNQKTWEGNKPFTEDEIKVALVTGHRVFKFWADKIEPTELVIKHPVEFQEV